MSREKKERKKKKNDDGGGVVAAAWHAQITPRQTDRCRVLGAASGSGETERERWLYIWSDVTGVTHGQPRLVSRWIEPEKAVLS